MGLILPMLRAVPVWAWALLAALAWGGWQRHQVQTISAELLKQQAAAAADREQALQASINETGRRLSAQQEVAHAADQAASAARADADAAAAVAARLRARLSAVQASGRPADPAAPGPGPTAGDDPRVLADLLARADERAGILAAHADAARVAGLACERAYDALTAAK